MCESSILLERLGHVVEPQQRAKWRASGVCQLCMKMFTQKRRRWLLSGSLLWFGYLRKTQFIRIERNLWRIKGMYVCRLALYRCNNPRTVTDLGEHRKLSVCVYRFPRHLSSDSPLATHLSRSAFNRIISSKTQTHQSFHHFSLFMENTTDNIAIPLATADF